MAGIAFSGVARLSRDVRRVRNVACDAPARRCAPSCGPVGPNGALVGIGIVQCHNVIDRNTDDVGG